MGIEEKRKGSDNRLSSGRTTIILWRECHEKVIYGEKTYMKPSIERRAFSRERGS